MRIAALASAALLLALLVPASARAQPGQTAPGDGWAAPGNQAAPAGLHLLTPAERRLLLRGEISDGEHIAGGLVGTFLGFGTGHAVQGRFSDRGWIFFLGEGAATVAVSMWLVGCIEDDFDLHSDDTVCNDRVGLLIGGLVAMAVFRTWELIDVWAGPANHNARVRALRARLRGGGTGVRWYAAPTLGGGSVRGGVAGVELRF